MNTAEVKVRTVRFKLDGRELAAPEGTFVLQVAREAGIDIPTLCEHPAVEPVGACRLCMVEVTHPDWSGWSGLMTSCVYPVAEGLEISTHSERVLESRKQVLTLFAARCPSSELIGELARKHGVDTSGLHVDPTADSCILCGLCTRICDTYVTSAITTWGRGAAKAIGTFDEAPPEDCVGCGSCALICPTGVIDAERGAEGYKIWGRTFETAVCEVERTLCVGCGSCEEACPFGVARVALSPDGRRIAKIPRDGCKGCGACVGACPSGAIDQEGYEELALAESLARGRAGVLACGRADLTPEMLPAGAELAPVPCTGRASTSLVLGALARGAEGVLVLGRHQESCRLDGAEDPARASVERVRAALELAGVDPERARFEVPAAGRGEPLRAVEDYLGRLGSLTPARPLGLPASALPRTLGLSPGLDGDLTVLEAYGRNEQLRPNGAAWLARHGLPAPRKNAPVLYAGDLPYIDCLGAHLFDPLSIPDVLRMALRALVGLGQGEAGVLIAGCGEPAEHHAQLFDCASAVYTLSRDDARALSELGVTAHSLEGLLAKSTRLPRPAQRQKVACDGSPEARRLIEALGHEPLDLGGAPLPRSFKLGPLQRAEAERVLEEAERAGAEALCILEPADLLRWSLVTRRGGWRSSRLLPLLPHSLACFAGAAVPLSVEALERPELLAPAALEVQA